MNDTMHSLNGKTPGFCGITLVDRSLKHLDKVAIVDRLGFYTYKQLQEDSQKMAAKLLQVRDRLDEEPIAFLVPASYNYVLAQWGIWRAGGIAVPLCIAHPIKEWAYVIRDTGCKRIIVHESFRAKILPLLEECAVELLDFNLDGVNGPKLPIIAEKGRAMIIYTSGTTGKPKGVVTTHDNIKSQITSLTKAWEWQGDDYILNVLPLHHVHGVVNILCCALWVGATCRFMERFDAELVWQAFKQEPLTLFMAVPTIYHKLIQSYEAADSAEKTSRHIACKKFRLMVSGSAALPVTVLEKWQKISGQVLLERYGMTEIGMALSNSYREKRIPGHVGRPLPSVETKVVDEKGIASPPLEPGELLVKGPSVFLEYWGKTAATKDAFVDGWFKTGDIVTENEAGIFKIVGRSSIDIIKSGGYKISALEIEEVLLRHPSISECAVVGLPNEEWGQVVAVALIAKADLPEEEALKRWAGEYLAKYKVPSRWLVLEQLPRNVMGKVLKKKVVELFA